MTLERNATLGPYSVTAKIGEGGMEEVYGARDFRMTTTIRDPQDRIASVNVYDKVAGP